LGLPTASEILRRRREEERRNDPNRPDDRPRPAEDRIPQPGDQDRQQTNRRGRAEDDSIRATLDQLYLTADSYLTALAEKTGGRVVRADTLRSLPDAFAKIAAELRTQYAIGYYPANKARDGQYRK